MGDERAAAETPTLTPNQALCNVPKPMDPENGHLADALIQTRLTMNPRIHVIWFPKIVPSRCVVEDTICHVCVSLRATSPIPKNAFAGLFAYA